tara:strand:- start:278 stop:1105 length:828 start_codon:yes stop_codon:yes gene_type:complete
MSEIINLIEHNPDSYIYKEAVEILSKKLKNDYSFILQAWDHEMPKETRYPKILISTSDEAHHTPDQVQDSSYVHIFKQYAPMRDPLDRTSVEAMDRVSPLPLGCLEGFVNKNIPIAEREYDWFWMGQFDPYTRRNFRQSTERLQQERPNYNSYVLWYEGWNNGIALGDYCDIMNNTKVALVPIGSGSSESFRFFEAMCAGCIVINVGMPQTPMYNAAPAFPMDTGWAELTRTMDFILSREEEVLEYHSNVARLWHEHFCSPENLAEYMFKRIEIC